MKAIKAQLKEEQTKKQRLEWYLQEVMLELTELKQQEAALDLLCNNRTQGFTTSSPSSPSSVSSEEDYQPDNQGSLSTSYFESGSQDQYFSWFQTAETTAFCPPTCSDLVIQLPLLQLGPYQEEGKDSNEQRRTSWSASRRQSLLLFADGDLLSVWDVDNWLSPSTSQ